MTIFNVHPKKAKPSDGYDFPIQVSVQQIIRTEGHHMYKLNDIGYTTRIVKFINIISTDAQDTREHNTYENTTHTVFNIII